MIAKFLDLDKRKIWIRTVLNFIALSQFYSICQMLAKISRVESEKTESKFRNRKRKLLSRVHVLHQAGAVKLGCSMSQSCNDGLERYRKKKPWYACNYGKHIPFLPFSLPSPSSLLKLPIVIQKFCYHGNVKPPRLFITKVSYKCIRPPLQSHNAVRNNTDFVSGYVQTTPSEFLIGWKFVRLVVAFARNHHNGMKM